MIPFVTLHELTTASTQKRSGEGVTSMPTRSDEEVKEILDTVKRELWYRQKSASEITTLFLVGAGDSLLLSALTRILPALRLVLLVDSDFAYLRRMAEPLPELSGALTLRDCVGLAGPESRRLSATDIYAACAVQMLERGLAIGDAVCVEDTLSLHKRRYVRKECSAGVRDLVYGFGIDFGRALEKSDWLSQCTQSLKVQLHAHADALYQQGQYLHALALYVPLYHALPERGPDLARQVAASWQELGRPDQSLRWLNRSGIPDHDLIGIAVELQQFAAELDRDGDAMLESNLVALQSRWPELAEAVAAADDGDDAVATVRGFPWLLGGKFGTEVAPLSDIPVVIQCSERYLDVVHVPEHCGIFGQRIANLGHVNECHALIGTSCAIDFLLNVVSHPVIVEIPNWAQSVTIIESNLSRLRAVLRSFELASFIDRDEVEWYWGEDAVEQFLEKLRLRSERPVPAMRGGISNELELELTKVSRFRTDCVYEAMETLKQNYDLHRLESIRDKIAKGAMLKIASITSRKTTVLQYVASDLDRAFASLGHDAHMVIEQDWREIINPLSVTIALAKILPDVIVMTDHLRTEYKNLLPPTLPSITWILDELPLLAEPECISKISPSDLIFAWSQGLCELYLGLGYPHCKKLCFAASSERYYPLGDVEYEDSVAYATHLSFPHDVAKLKGFMRFYASLLECREVLPGGRYENRELVADALKKFGARALSESELEAVSYQALLVNRHIDRVRIADAAIRAGIPIALYGHGWSEIPRFQKYARGVVRPGPELNRMYQQHKVVLHINQNCTLHPRVFETICAGGFILARSNGEHDWGEDGVSKVLEIGRDICVFDDEKDMIEKIERARHDESWRRGFIERGQARVLEENQYLHRAAVMLHELEGQLEFAIRELRERRAS